MLKSNVRKSLEMATYFGIVIVVLISVVLIERALTKNPNDSTPYVYVMKDMLDNDIPVIGKNQIMLKPFTDTKVKVVKSFYNYLDDKEKQENAIIYNDGTYMQNSGVDFGGATGFDVIAVLDGTVIDVTEDPLLGKTVQIRHNNELISVYQSLSEVKVKKDDTILRSQIIGKSGLSNIAKDLGDHLHFELFYKGQVVNPLEYFDKEIE